MGRKAVLANSYIFFLWLLYMTLQNAYSTGSVWIAIVQHCVALDVHMQLGHSVIG